MSLREAGKMASPLHSLRKSYFSGGFNGFLRMTHLLPPAYPHHNLSCGDFPPHPLSVHWIVPRETCPDVSPLLDHCLTGHLSF